MKNKRTDTERINWIEHRVSVEKKEMIFWPDKIPPLPGYCVSSKEKDVRSCIDFLMEREDRDFRLSDLKHRIQLIQKRNKK